MVKGNPIFLYDHLKRTIQFKNRLWLISKTIIDGISQNPRSLYGLLRVSSAIDYHVLFYLYNKFAKLKKEMGFLA